MSVRKLLVALLTLLYGLLFAGGIVSYAINGGNSAEARWAGPLFLFGAFALVMLHARGRLVWWLVGAAVGGFTAELLGLQTGLVFGHYSYTDQLGWRLLDVPVAIAAAWGVLLAYAACLGRLFPRVLGAVIGAGWMVVADLLIDPLASGPLRYWSWDPAGPYFGVQLVNFAGWFVVSFVLLLGLPRSHPPSPVHRLLGMSIIVFYSSLALLNRGCEWLALIGAALLCLDQLVAHLARRKPQPGAAGFLAAAPSVFVLTSPMPVSASELYNWHAAQGAFEQLKPPWQKIEVVQAPSSVEVGQLADVVLIFGPLRVPWSSRIVSVEPGRSFTDEQLSGPWSYWRHEHRFDKAGEQGSILEDRVTYRVPGDLVGELLGGWIAELQLSRLFSFRHRKLEELLTGKKE
jgi:ligand-binding SRPBCC domain-containing protein/uncharacterized membrane protein